MADQDTFSTDVNEGTMTVRFSVNSLVFPDQLRSLEELVNSQDGITNVVLDLSGVDHVSSSIWGEMIRLKQFFSGDSCDLRIRSMGEHVQDAFNIMKLGEVLDTE